MYKVYKVRFIGSYGGGMGLIAADDSSEAEWMMKVKVKNDLDRERFVVEGIMPKLHADSKGVLAWSFYIE